MSYTTIHFHTDHPSSREIYPIYLTHESSIYNSACLNTLWVNIDGVQGMIIRGVTHLILHLLFLGIRIIVDNRSPDGGKHASK